MIITRLCSLPERFQQFLEKCPARRRASLFLVPLAGIAVGLLMTGVLIRGRSTLFTVVTCLSLPLLCLLAHRARKVFVLAAMLTALIAGGFVITPFSMGDAPSNVSITYNLLVHGVYSATEAPDPDTEVAYSSFREPVLPVSLLPFAAAALHDLSELPPAQRLERLNVHPYLKGATVLWSALLLLGMWTLAASRSVPLAGWLAMSFSFIYFCRENIGVMLSEIPAAALFVWLSFCMAKGIETRRAGWYALSGLIAALLALTKLLFFYLFLGSMPLLMLALCRKNALGVRESLRLAGTSLAVFALCLSGYVALSVYCHPGIHPRDVLFSERGNHVMAARALKNFMTADERVGSLYVYSRGGINTIAGWLLDADKKDAERGGRWERLSRGTDRAKEDDDKGEEPKWVKDPRSYYVLAKDEATIANATRIIKDNLALHLAMSPIFLYRGIFGLATGSLGVLLFLYSATRFFLAVFKNRTEELAVLWYPLAMIGAYAVTSHFIPRYAYPMSPILETWLIIQLTLWGQAKVRACCRGTDLPDGP